MHRIVCIVLSYFLLSRRTISFLVIVINLVFSDSWLHYILHSTSLLVVTPMSHSFVPTPALVIPSIVPFWTFRRLGKGAYTLEAFADRTSGRSGIRDSAGGTKGEIDPGGRGSRIVSSVEIASP